MSAHNGSHDHGEHDGSLYMKIFLFLFALTAIEVGISYIMIPAIRPFIIAMLLLIGAVKATFVALYYMHLKGEGKLIYGAALLPLLWAVIMIVTVSLDVNAAQWSKVTVHPSQAPSAGHGHGGGHGSSSDDHGSSSHSTEEDEWGGGEEESYFEEEAEVASSDDSGSESDSGSTPAAAGAVSVKYYKGAPGGIDYLRDDPSFYK